jgi:hypothetical protein
MKDKSKAKQEADEIVFYLDELLDKYDKLSDGTKEILSSAGVDDGIEPGSDSALRTLNEAKAVSEKAGNGFSLSQEEYDILDDAVCVSANCSSDVEIASALAGFGKNSGIPVSNAPDRLIEDLDIINDRLVCGKGSEKPTPISIIAAVFGLLGGIGGIVFGAIGLKNPKNAMSRVLCTAGIALGSAWLVALCVVLLLKTGTTPAVL